MNERQIFEAALAIDDPQSRAAYLARACPGDQSRVHMLEMLEAQQRLGSFLEQPVAAAVANSPTIIDRPPVETVGTQIGPYKLLEQIGEGGMGVVYVAEQTEPVRRRVALKIVKPGMDTREVLARFEAERQALAMMNHPHIAKILDGGATETGRPYFVMELVKGVPITDYCNQHKLTVRQRLGLFMLVCQAVQHAHQKGIIHRDLKPSNVLVELHDVIPVPKVIDFGIAKATGQSLSERTLYTQYSQLVGTPLYMSPEQAELSGLDVDTRSDVYSLGVMLYELLTGATPFDQTTLTKGGLDEMRRIIREVEPPRPSHKVSTLQAGQLSTISEQRQADARKLSLSMQRELDWVVMKSLEKDRARRYESPSALAADLQRYLHDEPVLACPPALGYRLRKVVRRHRALLTTAGLLTATLLVATGVSISFAIQADQERDTAKLEREKSIAAETKAIAAEQLAERRLKQSQADFDQALKSLDTLVAEFSSAEFAQLPGADRIRSDILQQAMMFYQKLVTEHDNNPTARLQQARAWRRISVIQAAIGQVSESLEAINRSVRILEELTREFPTSRDYQPSLSAALFDRIHNPGRTADEQLEDAEWTLKLAEERIPFAARDETQKLLLYYVKVAEHLPVESPRVQLLLERCLTLAEQIGVEPPPGALIVLARTLEHDGELVEAERLCRRGIELYETIGADPDKRDSHIERWLASVESGYLGQLLERMHRPKDAEVAYRQALRIATQVCRDYGQIPRYRESRIATARDLLRLLTEQQQRPEALTVLQELLKEVPDTDNLDEFHSLQAELQARQPDAISSLTGSIEKYPSISSYYYRRGIQRAKQKDYGAAIPDFETARKLDPEDEWYEYWLADVLVDAGRNEEARAIYESLTTDGRQQVHRHQARFYFRIQEYAEFLKHLRAALHEERGELDVIRFVAPGRVAAGLKESWKEQYLEAVDLAVKLNHRSAESLSTRAAILMEFGEVERARPDFEAILVALPNSAYLRYHVALAALSCNDPVRYRTVSRDMLAAFTDTQKPGEASFTAWTCSLAPDTLDDYAMAIQLAERAVAAAPEDWWNLVCLGAVLLRSGNAERALETLARARQGDLSAKTSAAYMSYLEALALQRLERSADAKAALAQANALAGLELTKTDSPPAWNRKLTFSLLRSEAEKLLGDANGYPPPPPLPEPP